MMNKERSIIRASWMGIGGNGILAIIKISAGLLYGSLALVGDGIDSLSDIVTSLISLFAARIMSEPPDRKHPWGHGRAEIIATRLIGFAMFLAGFQLLLQSIGEIRMPHDKPLPSAAAMAALIISVIVKSGLALYKGRLGHRLNSALLKSDAVNMRNDVFLSLGVLLGILICRMTGIALFDSLIALLLALYILWSSVSIFRQSGEQLMDGLNDPLIYEKVFAAVAVVEGALNPHRCRIRQIGTLYDIDLDIEVEGSVTVRESHDIASSVERAIKSNLPEIYDIMVHVEPSGHDRDEEQFGLTPDSLDDFSDK